MREARRMKREINGDTERVEWRKRERERENKRKEWQQILTHVIVHNSKRI